MSRLRHWCSSRYLNIPPLHLEFHSPLPLSRLAVSPAIFPLSGEDFTKRLTDPPTRPLRPIIPNNARTLRVTAAAGTELAGAFLRGTFNPQNDGNGALFPRDSGLQSEDRHPTRGVAPSDFRPLWMPLDCCPP